MEAEKKREKTPLVRAGKSGLPRGHAIHFDVAKSEKASRHTIPRPTGHRPHGGFRVMFPFMQRTLPQVLVFGGPSGGPFV